MNFGNMGFMEILLILVVVLLLFGARRLPEIGASFGKSIKEFKKGISDVDRSIHEETRSSLPPRQAEPLTRTKKRARIPSGSSRSATRWARAQAKSWSAGWEAGDCAASLPINEGAAVPLTKRAQHLLRPPCHPMIVRASAKSSAAGRWC